MGMEYASDSRLRELTHWVIEELGFAGGRIEPASADASFRRYFRLLCGGNTHIIMDAPPAQEDVRPFVNVARTLASFGLNVPRVLAQDVQRGFLLLSDLGARHYLDELSADRDVDRLYGDALSALVTLQTMGDQAARSLPRYDRPLLLRETALMPEWFLGRHLGLDASAFQPMLDRLFDVLVDAALAQPVVFVHRDYHSRNLLLTARDNPGILDFQDAVAGPLTYDAVSLLKDCYIAWPSARVRDWVLGYREQLICKGVQAGGDADEFLRWFDLMGLQRHIKVLGIFARLHHRDGKRGYLKDLPRVLAYAHGTAAAHPQTAEFARFLSAEVAPAFESAQRRLGV